MSMHRVSKRKSSRGIAMVTALLIIAVLLIMVLPLMDIMRSEVVLTGAHGTSNAALRAAYAGVEETVYQFELNDAGAAPGVPPTSPQTSGALNNDDGSVSTYSVVIDPTIWNSVLPYYVLHSTGTTGNSVRRVDALIQKQPYTAWGLFTISEVNNKGGAVVYTSPETFQGPVYSGGPMNILYTPGNNPPIFAGGATTASPPNWINGAPATPADWQGISGTAGNFVQVSQAKTLPTAADNTAVQDAALVGDPNPSTPPVPPVANGLYINDKPVAGGSGALGSGIYISGTTTVTSVGNDVGKTNTFTFNVCCPGGSAATYIVLINFALGTTTVTGGPPSFTPLASYTGVPSGQNPPTVVGPVGAIFGSGTMSFNAGNTYEGQYTFAVPDGKGMTNPNMYMYGSQQYAPGSTASELAFWANDIVLNDLVSANIEIDGLLLTGYYGECSAICTDGTFYNLNCPATGKCLGGTGTLTLFGSLIEDVRGKRGTLGSTISGFDTKGVFDPRLARTPPPFTPTTTAYVVISLCTADLGTTCGQ